MSRPMSFGRFEIGLTAGGEPAHDATPRPDTPFRIALMGDFGRRGDPARTARPVLVDRDNLEEVMARLGVTVHVPLAGEQPLALSFAELDDFHPDRLFAKLEPFQALRQLRSELGEPATFARAAARMRAATGAPATEAAPPPDDPAQLLSQILGEEPALPKPKSGPSAGSLEEFLRGVVAPHLVPRIDQAKKAELEAVVDEAASARMRELLRNPEFRAVEAAWRGAWWLVRRLETDSLLQVHLIDLPKTALADTGTVERLLDADGQPWGLLVGLHAFTADMDDVELLAYMARLGRHLGAPFIAEAGPRLLGCGSLAQAPYPADWQPLTGKEAQAWDELRQLPEAAYLGLALPRFLLRLPYGKEAASVEQFGFEELGPGPDHEAFLWGSPGLLCACLFGEAFSRFGWAFGRRLGREVAGLPMSVYQEDGESRAKPCGEVVLGDRAAEAILARGLIPVLSASGSDAVQLPCLQSLAATPGPLAGRWS